MGDVTTTNKVDSLEDESPFKKRKTSKKEKHHQAPEAGTISDSSDKPVQQSGNQLSHDDTNGVGGGETFHTEVTKKRKKSKKEKLEQEIPTAQISENSPGNERPPKKKKKSKKENSTRYLKLE